MVLGRSCTRGPSALPDEDALDDPFFLSFSFLGGPMAAGERTDRGNPLRAPGEMGWDAIFIGSRETLNPKAFKV
jgi:hypothetical protein